MSFSALTKDELARVVGPRLCCRVAELAALAKMDGRIKADDGRYSLQIVTENAAVARKIFSLIKRISDLNAEVLARRETRLRRKNVYVVRIPLQEGVRDLLKKLGINVRTADEGKPVRTSLTRRDCCRRAYLRGAFLGGGSVSSPEGEYHLEIVSGTEKHARYIEKLMQKLNVAARMSAKKNRYVVYLKESEQIVNFLSIIGAHAALLNFESTRIFKDMRNQVNRLVNCETANLNKTVNAAVRQLENIKLISETIGLDSLPPPLKEVAELRLSYPDANLKELGDMCGPRLGKSGANHRLRRLEEIAEEIRERGQ